MIKTLTAMIAVTAAVCAAAAPAEAARKKAASPASRAALAAAPHEARFERGFVCYTDHYHYGSSGGQSSRQAAQAAAAGSWSSFVSFEYGSSWASFAKAGSKKMSCDQSGGSWNCSVEARPCR